MPMPFQKPRPISDEELEKYLEVMIKKLLEKKPGLAKDPKVVNELVNEAMKLIDEKFIDLPHEKTLNNLLEPHFVQKLALSLTLTAEIKGDKEMAKTLDKAFEKVMKDPNFKAEFKKISPHDIAAMTKLDKLLDKYFNKEQKELIKDALKTLNKFFGTKFGEKDKEKGKDKQAGKSEEPDEYINLYGLINSRVTGGLAVPVYTNFGTRDFVDQNPNIGSAPIDQVNNINDTGHGDSQGLNAKAMQNFGKIAGNIVSTEDTKHILGELQAEGMEPRTSPQNRPY